MRVIEVTVKVDEQGKLEAQLPPDIEPGEHQAVIVLAETNGSEPKLETTPRKKSVLSAFRGYPFGLVDPNFTMRREELYDTDRGYPPYDLRERN